MRREQLVVLVLACIATLMWGILLTTGSGRATAWAPAVEDAAPLTAPRVGMSRILYAETGATDGAWIEWVGATHVSPFACSETTSLDQIASDAVKGVCDGARRDDVEVDRLDNRNELGHCVTEVRLRVTCS